MEMHHNDPTLVPLLQRAKDRREDTEADLGSDEYFLKDGILY